MASLQMLEKGAALYYSTHSGLPLPGFLPPPQDCLHLSAVHLEKYFKGVFFQSVVTIKLILPALDIRRKFYAEVSWGPSLTSLGSTPSASCLADDMCKLHLLKQFFFLLSPWFLSCSNMWSHGLMLGVGRSWIFHLTRHSKIYNFLLI